MMIELQSTGSYETRHGVMWTVANPLPTGPTDTMRRKLTGAMVMLDGKRVIIDAVEMYMPMTYRQGAPIAIRVRDADACFHPTDALVEHSSSTRDGDIETTAYRYECKRCGAMLDGRNNPMAADA